MSERSEFGLRAPSTEKRRGPMRLHRIGSRPAMAFLLTFGKTKVSRATARKPCPSQENLIALKAKSESVQSIARLSHADACEFLFDRPKRNQKALSPDAIRHGCAVPVPCAPRLTRHAAQTRCAQTWAALRPRQAAVLGSLYGSIDQRLKAEAEAKKRS